MHVMYRAAAACVLVLSVIGTAPTATAAPADNGQSPEPLLAEFTLDAGVFCDFPLHIVVEGKTKTLELGDGRMIVTAPGQQLTATNLETGQVLESSLTGAFHTVTLADGSVVTRATGRNLLGDPVAGLVITTGNYSFTMAADGVTNLVPLDGNGQMLDVCAALS